MTCMVLGPVTEAEKTPGAEVRPPPEVLFTGMEYGCNNNVGSNRLRGQIIVCELVKYPLSAVLGH